MKTLISALLVLLLSGPAGAEFYAYSVSGSETDPWDNQGVPQVGIYRLYVWFACDRIDAEPAETGGFRLGGSLAGEILGSNQFTPAQVIDLGDGNYAWGWQGPCGTLQAPVPLIELTMFSATGLGGDLCVLELDESPFSRYVADCNLQDYPAAAQGFTNDGTAPCVIGSCESPVSTGNGSWGAVKSLYR